MVTQDEKAHPSAPPGELTGERSPAPADRFKRLPPAVSISTAVAVVGVPTVPLGPEGAAGGGDGD